MSVRKTEKRGGGAATEAGRRRDRQKETET